MAKKKNAKSEGEGEDDNKSTDTKVELFEAVKEHSTVAAAIEDWIKRYTADRVKATAELINFIIQSCGCSATIEVSQLKKEGIDSLIKRIITTEYLEGGEAEYPIVSRQAALRRFQKSFADVWGKLVAKLPTKLLHDGFLMESVVSWLVAFSNANARPFRHTATVAALRLVTALAKAATRSAGELDVARRQLKGEDDSTHKGQQLQRKVDSLHDHVMGLEKLMTAVYTDVFTTRYRDVYAEVRRACAEELGAWMETYPSLFLDVLHLKYLGWLLYDRVAEVRCAVLDALHRLYQREDLLPSLQFFTQRYAARLAQMCFDVDPGAAAAAVRVCTVLARHGMLEGDATKDLPKLLNDPDPSLRHEVAAFVREVHFGKAQQGAAALRALVKLVSGAGAAEMPQLAVDALWGALDVLTDWGAMSDELSHGKLTEREARLLAKVLGAAARRAAGRAIVPRPSKDRDTPAARQANVEALTKALGKALPALLRRYQGAPDVLSELAEVPQCFHMATLAQLKGKTTIKELCAALTEVVERHAEEAVLEAAAGTLRHFSTGDHPLQHEGERAAGDVVRGLVDQLSQAEEAGEDDRAAGALTRLAALASALDVERLGGGWGEASTLLDGASAPEVAAPAVRLVHCMMLWLVSKLDRDHPDPRSLNLIAHRTAALARQLPPLLRSDDAALRGRALAAACDLLALLPPSLAGTALDKIALHPAPAALLDGVVQAFVKEWEAACAEEGEARDAGQEAAMGAVGKAIAAGALPEELAAVVVSCLPDCGKAAGDVLRAVLQANQKREGRNAYRIHVRALLQALAPVLTAGDDDERETQATRLGELAHKLALGYGVQVAGAAQESLQLLVTEVAMQAVHPPDDPVEGEAPRDRLVLLSAAQRMLSKVTPAGAARLARDLRDQVTRLPADYAPREGEDQAYWSFLEHLDKVAHKSTPAKQQPKRKRQGKGKGKVRKELQLEIEPVPDRRPAPAEEEGEAEASAGEEEAEGGEEGVPASPPKRRRRGGKAETSPKPEGKGKRKGKEQTGKASPKANGKGKEEASPKGKGKVTPRTKRSKV